MIHIPKWGNWHIVNEGKEIERSLKDPKQEDRVVGIIIIQKRVCHSCGYTQFKKQLI